MKKKRNIQKTRQDILDAAAVCFSDKGYDSVGLREIANKANIDVALINRYFGSKKGLFCEAVIPSISLDYVTQENTGTLAEQLTEVSFNYQPNGLNILTATLNSIDNDNVNKEISEAIKNDIVEPIAQSIQGKEAAQRALLTAALSFGFSTMHHVLKINEDISEKDKQTLQALLQSHFDLMLKSNL